MRRLRDHLQVSRQTFAAALANRDLRRIQLAWAGSVFGAWAYVSALAVYAFQDGGATAVGLVAFARWTLSAAASPLLAVLADRYPRRRVMIGSDLTRAAALGGAAVLVLAGGPPPAVYALIVIAAIASTAFRPAEASLIPSLARTPEELTASNTVSSTIEAVGMFGGPGLAGLLLVFTSPGVVFAFTAASLVWSALLVLGIREPARAAPEASEEGGREALLAGARSVLGDRGLRLVIGLFSAQTFVDGMLNVLLIVTAIEVLELGDSGVGFLNAAVGVGGIIGGALAAGLVGRRRLGADFGLGILFWGLPLVLIAAWPSTVTALALLVVLGIANTIADVSGFTLIQRTAKEELLGRVFGVLEAMILVAVGVGAVVAPFVVDALGPRKTLAVAGGVLPVLVVLRWKRLREIDAVTTVPERGLELLRSNPIFAPLQAPALERLARSLQPTRVEPGEIVFRQGDAGDRFYVVGEGRVAVEVDGKPRELGPGDAFGEIALLRDVPRTATVRAISDVELYALDREEFIAAVSGSAASSEAAEAVVHARLAGARAG